MRSQAILTLLTILLSLTVVITFGWGKTKEVESLEFQEKTFALTSQVNELDVLKKELQSEIDSLMIAYEEVKTANHSLQKKVSRKNKAIDEKNELIAQIQEANFERTQSLTDQIKELIEMKTNLQTTIHKVHRQNDSLVVIVEKRIEERRQARKIARDLAAQNNKLEIENDGLMLKNFKATAFRIELEGKNGKIMSKAKRIKKIKVSFDLNEIPEKYQENRPVYMVIKNEKNHPIATQALFPALIQREDQSLNIEAVMRKELDILEKQRVDFEYNIEDKMEAGYYEIEIYTDIALLGKTSFRAG